LTKRQSKKQYGRKETWMTATQVSYSAFKINRELKTDDLG
jgi:hypothetical protein